MRRTAVLISGSGSNLEALIRATRASEVAAEIVFVVSDTADAFGLERARRAGIPREVVERRSFSSRAAFEAALQAVLDAHAVELVCLAGFMRILSGGFVASQAGRLLNIHPSLLPAFPGLDTHARALAAGVRVSGCTVHFATDEVDQGPIVVQGVVPVLEEDDAETLRARVLEVEHRCYPLALDLVARGIVGLERRRVASSGTERPKRLVLHPLLVDLERAPQPTISISLKK